MDWSIVRRDFAMTKESNAIEVIYSLNELVGRWRRSMTVEYRLLRSVLLFASLQRRESLLFNDRRGRKIDLTLQRDRFPCRTVGVRGDADVRSTVFKSKRHVGGKEHRRFREIQIALKRLSFAEFSSLKKRIRSNAQYPTVAKWYQPVMWDHRWDIRSLEPNRERLEDDCNEFLAWLWWMEARLIRTDEDRRSLERDSQSSTEIFDDEHFFGQSNTILSSTNVSTEIRIRDGRKFKDTVRMLIR